MRSSDFFLQLQEFLLAMVYTQPRILGMFVPIPLFARGVMPATLRTAVAMGVGLVVAPMVMPHLAGQTIGDWRILLTLAKEAFVGFVLGCLIAVPFWAFEAVGFLVDNQRGASIAATLNPLTGNDSSPLGILFNQAFIVFFFVSGGFLLMLEILYESYRLWPVLQWRPTLHADSVPVMIEQVMRLVRLGLLLAAPAVISMFLAELGLALVSRFVPQLQVFFLAMPIKSGLVLLVLMLYMGTLFEYAGEHVGRLREVLPLLQQHWAPATGVPR